jgi:hypothetical protein
VTRTIFMLTNPKNPEQRYVVAHVSCPADRELAYKQSKATHKDIAHTQLEATDKTRERSDPAADGKS